jgi:hypothetical protein
VSDGPVKLNYAKPAEHYGDPADSPFWDVALFAILLAVVVVELPRVAVGVIETIVGLIAQ